MMSFEEKISSKIDNDQYQILVGKLIYLSHSRSCFSYAVSVMSQCMHDLKARRLQVVNRVLRYLISGNITMETYSNVDYDIK